MNFLKIIWIAILTIPCKLIFSCTCNEAPRDFCTMLSNNEFQIMRTAQIIEFQGHFNQIAKVKVFKENEIEVNDTIYILGQDGLGCGFSIQNFQLNDSIIFLAHSSAHTYYSSTYVYDSLVLDSVFYVDGCDFNALFLSNDSIYGYYKPTYSSYAYSDFINELDYCKDFVTIEDKHNFSTQIYPNPSFNFTWINANEIIHEIEIYDLKGNLVFMEKAINDFTYQINLSEFALGSYIIGIKNKNHVQYKPLLIAY